MRLHDIGTMNTHDEHSTAQIQTKQVWLLLDDHSALHPIPKLIVVHPPLQQSAYGVHSHSTGHKTTHLVIRLGRIAESQVRCQSNHIIRVMVDG